MTTFIFEGIEIHAEDGGTVLSALLQNKVDIKSGCQVGACQSCLVRSNEPVPPSSQMGLDESLIERGFFLSCQARPQDVTSVERLDREIFPQFPALLAEKRWVTEDVLVLGFDVPRWKASPGRFVRLSHSGGVTRPYSLAAPAWMSDSVVQIHVRVIPGGAMSQVLAIANLGDRFTIEGPFGKCCYRSKTRQEPILLIGSGTGLAPLYGVITDALTSGHQGSIYLYHGAATSSRLYFHDELTHLTSRFENFTYSTFADSEVVGNDQEGSPLVGALRDHPVLDGYKVYLCGHPNLVKAGQRKCFLAGANLKDIAADPFVAG